MPATTYLILLQFCSYSVLQMSKNESQNVPDTGTFSFEGPCLYKQFESWGIGITAPVLGHPDPGQGALPKAWLTTLRQRAGSPTSRLWLASQVQILSKGTQSGSHGDHGGWGGVPAHSWSESSAGGEVTWYSCGCGTLGGDKGQWGWGGRRLKWGGTAQGHTPK